MVPKRHHRPSDKTGWVVVALGKVALLCVVVVSLGRVASAAGPMSVEDPFAFCQTFVGTVNAPMWSGKQRPIQLQIDQPAATSGAWKVSSDVLAKVQKAPGRRILLREHVISEDTQVKVFKDHMARFSGDIEIPFFDALGITDGLPPLLKAGVKALPVLISLGVKQLGKKQAAVASEIGVVMEKGAKFEEWGILSQQSNPHVLTALTVYRVKVQANDRRYGLCSTTAEVSVQ